MARRLSLRAMLPAARVFLRAQALQHGPWREFAWRACFAAGATALLISLALFGLWTADGPEWLGLAFEPLSLFLLPGFFISVLVAGAHDLDPFMIVVASVLLYFAAFYWLLRRRERSASSRQARAARQSA